MGQAHSRGFRRGPSYFPDRSYDPRLVICGDNMDGRGEMAVADFGFEESAKDWQAVIDHPDVRSARSRTTAAASSRCTARIPWAY